MSTRCTAVLAATAVSEAVSACILLLFYRGEAVRAFGAEKARRPADPARRRASRCRSFHDRARTSRRPRR